MWNHTIKILLSKAILPPAMTCHPDIAHVPQFLESCLAWSTHSDHILYQFDHKFTNSEILVTKMANKFSFQFWRLKMGAFFLAVTCDWTYGQIGTVCFVFKIYGSKIMNLRKAFRALVLAFPVMKTITKKSLLACDYLHEICGIIHCGKCVSTSLDVSITNLWVSSTSMSFDYKFPRWTDIMTDNYANIVSKKFRVACDLIMNL